MDQRSVSPRRPTLVFLCGTSWYLWNFRSRMAGWLISRGYDVLFMAPLDAYSERLAATGRYVPIELDRKGTNPVLEAKSLLGLVRKIRDQQPDVVLSWTPKANILGGLACRWLGIPFIPNVAGLGTGLSGGRGLSWVVPKLYRQGLCRAGTVFFQNLEDRKLLVEAGAVDLERTAVLPGSGVDLERFAQTPLPPAPLVFLFAGRLLAEKGIRVLVEAARRLQSESSRPFELRVAGFVDQGNPTAIAHSELDAWEREGLLTFRGQSDRMESEIAAAHCVVHPTWYREGRPRILLEAASCGRPAITTDTTGCRDAVVHEETGLLVKPADVDSLFHAMHSMLHAAPARLEEMGHAARRLAETEFAEELVFVQYGNALDRLGSGNTRQEVA